MRTRLAFLSCSAALWASGALAADQTVPGAGNALAAQIAQQSAFVQQKLHYLV
ncbi:MAG TPA: hypothetical protein VMK42_06340 [Anaeromyxobacteraceae bacterium]|nr:hypothetical protein [Anaeromyxobacteraceae bacterium]